MSGFLDRWSKAKRAAEAKAAAEAGTEAGPAPGEAVTPPEAVAADRAADRAGDRAEEMTEEEALAALPPLDSITAQTDIAPFLRPRVPRALRNAAMRKMWLLDPVIRDHKDVAVDYAWDWNTPGGVPGNGGAVDPEGVAKLVRGMFGDRTGPEEAVAAAGPPPEDAAEPELPEPRAPEDPVRAPVRPEPPAAVEIAEAPKGSAPAAPRRHGGALPG